MTNSNKIDSTTIMLHVILFFTLFTYGYEYLLSYLSFPNPQIFQSLDQLTGKPYLINRICSFTYAAALYLFFTLIWERENWKKALFIQNPFPGLAKGAAYSLLTVLLSFLLLIITKTIVIDGWAANASHISALLFAWFIAQIFNSIKEEVVYRGYLLRRLAGKFNKHLSILTVSLAFGIGHLTQYSYSGAILATVFGLIAGYLYLYYKNIYVPIGMHATWDICSHTLLAGKIVAFQTGVQYFWLNTENVYFALIIFSDIVLLVSFFIWKKQWRLHNL